MFIYKDIRRRRHIYTTLPSHTPLRLCGKRQVSRRLLHQHFSAGQCPSLRSTSIQGGHRSQPPLFTLTSSLAGLNIRPGSSEACVSDSHSVRSWLGAADICNSFPALLKSVYRLRPGLKRHQIISSISKEIMLILRNSLPFG